MIIFILLVKLNMKNKRKWSLFFALSFVVGSVLAQESLNTSGGDAAGSGGTVAYTIGQVAYTNHSGANGDVNQGVQQPYEIYFVSIDEDDIRIELSAYPNPTSDNIKIQFEEFGNRDAIICLIDQSGKLLAESKVNNSTAKLEMAQYETGIYILKVISENQLIKSFKIIKH
jgi:hypothetical protein